MRIDDVRRVFLGSFVRPPEETGTGSPKIEAVYGYAVPHADGLLLLDTGIGAADEETEAWYRPQRVPLPQAMRDAGVDIDDVQFVVNCHLHFDHCGGNPGLAGLPVFTQRTELATARGGDYTVGELIDHPGVRYEVLDGRAEILPGVHVVPTPGHVAGHQSVIVECDDGSIVLAGQSHETASLWSEDALARSGADLGHAPPLPVAPDWVDTLLAFDPRRVAFAHDAAIWVPDGSPRR
ncbi:MBL fold metallo-hydrolase [Allobranchiibius huperziae]|uniref:N-acyl homoserine lactone hydrolase n=1 Tax=Allobranchiibius huperziae TaxID=1874116 RepID=A0A853DBB1_9MICO|nr:MBL fold metallo-hydrolase [Allobranchiibius huperziae]NYJ74572.1 N-acyl homoserine lactone hydrolase [Allobranchiibius huperziae]